MKQYKNGLNVKMGDKGYYYFNNDYLIDMAMMEEYASNGFDCTDKEEYADLLSVLISQHVAHHYGFERILWDSFRYAVIGYEEDSEGRKRKDILLIKGVILESTNMRQVMASPPIISNVEDDIFYNSIFNITPDDWDEWQTIKPDEEDEYADDMLRDMTPAGNA